MEDFFSDYKPKHSLDESSGESIDATVEIKEASADNAEEIGTDATALTEKNDGSEPEKTSFKQEIFDWLDVLTTAIIAVVIIFTFIFRIATIKGPSMQNTLLSGDRVVISNLAYTPKQGDIVVISRNIDNSTESESDVPIIKRVIAVGGQTVNIDFQNGKVSVDNQELDESYVNTPTNKSFDIEFPVTVPEGYIFVLGDNRNSSLDSRSSLIGEKGMIDTRYVLGQAIFRVFPFNSIGRLK